MSTDTDAASGGSRAGQVPNGANTIPIFPPLTRLLAGAVGWGALMSLSAIVSLYRRNHLETLHLMELAVLFFAGGLLAWPFIVPTARLLSRYGRVETRFAACFVLLALGTIAMTAFLFAMDYRLFYAQWHHPILSRMGIRQFVGTSASGVYQFAVMGLGLYLPAGLPVLAGVSLWLAKAMR
ncbi:hypothetical protein [Mycoplana ramosa]|uniref:Uncharacterized protein n=1 Tax=Mycoplana ramosa TaxID=40837 RepID=A0ABW3YSI0_MYCRA